MVEFRLSHTEEIKRWLLSFGRHAEVLEPPALREDMRQELASMVQRYASESLGDGDSPDSLITEPGRVR